MTERSVADLLGDLPRSAESLEQVSAWLRAQTRSADTDEPDDPEMGTQPDGEGNPEENDSDKERGIFIL